MRSSTDVRVSGELWRPRREETILRSSPDFRFLQSPSTVTSRSQPLDHGCAESTGESLLMRHEWMSAELGRMKRDVRHVLGSCPSKRSATV